VGIFFAQELESASFEDWGFCLVLKPIEYKTRQNLYRGGVPKKSFQNFLFIQETFVSLLKQ
jgi:hypothetical protein